MQNDKPLLWHASTCGAFMTEKRGYSITDRQLSTLAQYESRHSGEGKPLTPNMVAELDDLRKKKIQSETPVLSDTAETLVKKMWLWREKGIRYDVKSKYLEKGIYREEEAISLLTDVTGEYYEKNRERRHNDKYTGECDIVKQNKSHRIIRDTKCTWSAETFMNSDPSLDNEWQGRVYMELWDADVFYLDFCLLDMPPHLLLKEKEYLYRKYTSDSMSDEERTVVDQKLERLYEQLDRNMVYSTNPTISKSECVKTFVFERDDAKMRVLDERQAMGREFYKSITLNGK